MIKCIFILTTLLSINCYSETIYLKGKIDQYSYSNFEQQLNQLKSRESVTVEIDSKGGELVYGIKIIDKIMQHKMNTYCTNLCASAAATIFMSGVVRTLHKNAFILFHELYLMFPKDTNITIYDLEKIHRDFKSNYNAYNRLNASLLKISLKSYMQKIKGTDWYISYETAKKLNIIK